MNTLELLILKELLSDLRAENTPEGEDLRAEEKEYSLTGKEVATVTNIVLAKVLFMLSQVDTSLLKSEMYKQISGQATVLASTDLLEKGQIDDLTSFTWEVFLNPEPKSELIQIANEVIHVNAEGELGTEKIVDVLSKIAQG